MDGINWEALGAIGEIIGSFGVFISLIYLAIQMRHGAAETRDASIHSVMQLAIQFRAESYTTEMAEIRMKVAAQDSLSPLESLKFEGYLSALFELNELVFVQYQKNKLDPEYFDAWQRRTKDAMTVTLVRQFWAKTKTGYRTSFIEHIDELL